ncbi:MAG: hypothetical protein K940chlam5_01162 [Candidatus Anoxychlamydiales bacterium]|nr:hypothetical protein [Candidatus Anoxychlamydiales bacterium]
MQKTIIIRHKKENLKKCSLKGLEKREDISFFTYPLITSSNEFPSLDLSNYVLLEMNAKELTKEDQNKGLLLIDSTWKYVDRILKILPENIEKRSLPQNYITAYPRKQTLCPDPIKGLASIEALYLAYLITNRDAKDLLENYFWREKFLKINSL